MADILVRAEIPVQDHPLWIDGAAAESASGRWRDSVDPFTGKVWARIADAGPADVDRAVASSRAAFESGPWARLNGRERGELMRELARLMRANVDELADVETRDNGKLVGESRRIVELSAGWYDYFAGWADKLQGDTIPMDNPALHVYTRRQAIGVVAAVTAWNSPMILAAYKLGPGLAAGCTFVLKPSEDASISTLLFARLVTEAGFPPGVVNCITGDGPNVGQPLVTHPGIDKVAFTGSAAVGALIAGAAARNLTPVMLELGGKSPQIVFPDANLDVAADQIAAGIFASAGQACVAGSRLFAHRSIVDDLRERIVARAGRLAMGDPLRADTTLGPLSFERHMERVIGMIERSRAEGATVLAGGARSTREGCTDGYFVEPTVLADVSPSAEIFREEVFGPVLVTAAFDDEAEAICLANDCRYGLASGVWTGNVGRAHRVAAALQAGTVWINTYRQVSHAVPFGGWKHSGYGVENGADSIREFTRTKVVWVDTAVPA